MVVLHVAVQLIEENAAVTPAGREEALNDTETALPVSKVAVRPSVTELPCTTERVGDAALSEMLEDTTGAVIVSEMVVDTVGAEPVPVTVRL